MDEKQEIVSEVNTGQEITNNLPSLSGQEKYTMLGQYPKWVRYSFFGVIIAFIASCVLIIFSMRQQPEDSFDNYGVLWFVAAGGGLLLFVSYLIVGIIHHVKKQGVRLIGFAFLALLIFAVVGYGTCLVNLKAVNM